MKTAFDNLKKLRITNYEGRGVGGGPSPNTEMDDQATTSSRNIVIYIDGASSGNPGDSGIGFVIYELSLHPSTPLRDDRGQVLERACQYIGQTTNNVAEYTALLHAQKRAIELSAENVQIYTDSELLARQMNGVYRVNSPNLQPLYEQAQRLKKEFKQFSIQSVKRDKNREADNLAKTAIKRHRAEAKSPLINGRELRSRQMYFFDIENLKERQLFDGIKIRTAFGENIMMSFVYFEPNSLVPEHSHPHEQMGTVMEGKFELIVNGNSKIVEKGDAYLVPSNVKHSARALDESAVALDIFSPPREEYK